MIWVDYPERDLPRALTGGSDLWDEPAGQIVASEFFSEPLSYALAADASSFALAGQDAGLTYAVPSTFDGAYNAMCNFCVNGGVLNGAAERWTYAEAGQYQETGFAAGTFYGRRVAAGAAAYTLAGQSANTLYGRLIGASAAGFTLTGFAANTLRGYRAAADAGAFTLALTPAGLLYTRIMQAAGTTLALTGYDAATLYGRAISPANAGAYAYAGGDADLIKVSGIIFDVTGGSYDFTGGDAQVLRGYLAHGDKGDYQLNTDFDAGFIRDYRLHPEEGEYFLDAQDANLYIDVFSPLLQRIFYVKADDRGLAVSAEKELQSVTIGLDRLFMVGKESRGFTVPAERGQ